MTAQHLPQEPRIERRRRPSGRRAAALDLTARADREAERQTDLDAVVADRELERAGSLPGLPQAAGDPVISASAAVPPPASALRATAEPTAADPRAVAAPGAERAPSGLVLEGPGRRVVLISADAGLGYLINDAREFLRTDVIVVGLAVYSLLGLLTDTLVRFIERKALSWRI